jgi:hypothetical protein
MEIYSSLLFFGNERTTGLRVVQTLNKNVDSILKIRVFIIVVIFKQKSNIILKNFCNLTHFI